MPGIQSPNPRNYAVSKGFSIFTPDDTGVAHHLGNMTQWLYTPKVEILPHYSTMAPIKVQDFTTILQAGGSVKADLEEMTAYNLSLFFQGSVDVTDPDNVKVGIYDVLESITGRMQFYATNNVGPRWLFDLTRVQITPSDTLNMISDAYNKMPITLSHIIDDEGLFGTITLQPDIRTVTPTNIFLPFIDGPLHLGDDPAFAKVGEVMSANVGMWIASQGYAYQWKKGGVNIALATSKTYIPVSGDSGATLTVAVTARNANGTTTATSGVTMAVHA
jgi:hypothetical protein